MRVLRNQGRNTFANRKRSTQGWIIPRMEYGDFRCAQAVSWKFALPDFVAAQFPVYRGGGWQQARPTNIRSAANQQQNSQQPRIRTLTPRFKADAGSAAADMNRPSTSGESLAKSTVSARRALAATRFPSECDTMKTRLPHAFKNSISWCKRSPEDGTQRGEIMVWILVAMSIETIGTPGSRWTMHHQTDT